MTIVAAFLGRHPGRDRGHDAQQLGARDIGEHRQVLELLRRHRPAGRHFRYRRWKLGRRRLDIAPQIGDLRHTRAAIAELGALQRRPVPAIGHETENDRSR